MTPEEKSQKIFNDWLGASRGDFVLEKGRKLRACISDAIKQARNEAIDEIYKLVDEFDYGCIFSPSLFAHALLEQIQKLKGEK
jgi:hypothetical protein